LSSLAGATESPRRRGLLSWSHHAEVAAHDAQNRCTEIKLLAATTHDQLPADIGVPIAKPTRHGWV
jgi:hypothetical protein